MNKLRAISTAQKVDPVRWMVGTMATGIAAAMTFLGTAIIAL